MREEREDGGTPAAITPLPPHPAHSCLLPVAGEDRDCKLAAFKHESGRCTLGRSSGKPSGTTPLSYKTPM